MKLKIAFSDFWQPFDGKSFFLSSLIRREYDVEIVGHDQHPDILFFSCFGSDHLFPNSRLKIYFTGENDVPDFNTCDYAISFHHIKFGNRHIRIPLYAIYPCYNILRKGLRPQALYNREFCSFVVSNSVNADPIREEFFHKLSEYKRVNSGGKLYNNVGGPVDDKLKFLQNHKFNIAFENSKVDGYTTEKLFDALAAGTLPIYWGNNLVEYDVPSDCYINVSNFKTISEAIEYIEKVDIDEDLYYSYFKTSPHASNPYLDWEEQFLDFFRIIIQNQSSYIPKAGIVKINKESTLLRHRCGNIHFVAKNIDKIERIIDLKNNLLASFINKFK